jgi:hypothetical protein
MFTTITELKFEPRSTKSRVDVVNHIIPCYPLMVPECPRAHKRDISHALFMIPKEIAVSKSMFTVWKSISDKNAISS